MRHHALFAVLALCALAATVTAVECGKDPWGSDTGQHCYGSGPIISCPTPLCNIFVWCPTIEKKYDFGSGTFYKYCDTGSDPEKCCRTVTLSYQPCQCQCRLACLWDNERYVDVHCVSCDTAVTENWYQPGVCERDLAGTPIGCLPSPP
jgi:hypothetical protein